MVRSDTSGSPGLDILDWDETAVHAWFKHIGLGQYEDLIYEQGITGDVLAVMDHSSLQDMGMTSVGHRLSLLRAVWEVKRDQGVDFGEDDWQPQDAIGATSNKGGVTSSDINRLLSMMNEQQERMLNLERNHQNLLSTLEEAGIQVPVASSSADGDRDPIYKGFLGLDGNANEMRFLAMAGNHSDPDEVKVVRSDGPSKVRRRASHVAPSTLALSTNSAPVPLTSSTATFQDSFTPNAATFQDSSTPTTASGTYPFQSPSAPLKADKGEIAPKPAVSRPAPLRRLISGNSIMSSNTGSPPAGSDLLAAPTSLALSTSKPSLVAPLPASSRSGVIDTSPTPTSLALTSSKPPPSGASTRQGLDLKADSGKSNKPFRVTLEDPCWRVLPAALKKYYIDDDWKVYALFICFETTERCLSYDEKPLMIFQKLKDAGHKPVFMLRHSRDIKSPIVVAQHKQAQKQGLPPNTIRSLLPKLKPNTDSSTSPTKSSSLRLGARMTDDGQTPNKGAFPELPSPVFKDGEGHTPGAPKSAGTTGTVVDQDGNVLRVTYAVAIYPYVADRQDEFDVAVGAAFVILNKAKGWVIVQRDPYGLGNIVVDQANSGWVPAGCLLDMSSPVSLVSPAIGETIPAYPGLAPVFPSAIRSSCYPAVILMDYQSKGEYELAVKEGDQVKVYKKYCHWSYTIKQDTGERGWVPAWFIGKVNTETVNLITNAATLTAASITTGAADTPGAEEIREKIFMGGEA